MASSGIAWHVQRQLGARGLKGWAGCRMRPYAAMMGSRRNAGGYYWRSEREWERLRRAQEALALKARVGRGARGR